MTRVISSLTLFVVMLLGARVVAAQTPPPTAVAADAKAEARGDHGSRRRDRHEDVRARSGRPDRPSP